MLRTPVAFMIFNRPYTTARVFAEIRTAKPKTLLLVADGPRPDRAGEAEVCATTRALVDAVDWDCQVLKNYSDDNLGCGRRVASGLTWVFGTVEEAIILEDDCVPHPSFFPYCEELLTRYRNEPRVWMISGNNFQFGRKRTPFSYYFSRYPDIWGWATWRRAWQKYDYCMSDWPTLRDTSWLADLLGDEETAKWWKHVFDSNPGTEIDTWDYQWYFAHFRNDTYSISPAVNLVSNIGWGEAASHTKGTGGHLANIRTKPMRFPLRHPASIEQCRAADDFTLRHRLSGIRPPGDVVGRVRDGIRRFFVRYPSLRFGW